MLKIANLMNSLTNARGQTAAAAIFEIRNLPRRPHARAPLVVYEIRTDDFTAIGAKKPKYADKNLQALYDMFNEYYNHNY